MHVVVLLAGIADSKRPLERPASGEWADVLAQPTTPFKPSPFDEAALEIALKLRDANPQIKLSAVVTAGCDDVALMRAVAAYRLDIVTGLRLPGGVGADPDLLAQHALEACASEDAPADLILIGREHGDLDDGMIAGYLAAKWGRPYFGLAQNVKAASNGSWQAERMGATALETYTLEGRPMVSITNAKINRLRHPLMKNVVLAKQQKFDIRTAQADTVNPRASVLGANTPPSVVRGTVPCEMLTGDANQQAKQLASILASGEDAHV